jgi:hypothetical protein
MRVAIATCVLLSASVAVAAPDADPRIAKLVASLSEERLAATLKRLEQFGTRHILAAGNRDAGQWLFDELSKHRRLRVSFDVHRIAAQPRVAHDVEIRNVLAVLPGKSGRRIYVSGHYDTIALTAGQSGVNARKSTPAPASEDAPAPGVNDDGSGTALTLELARAFADSDLQPDATLVFMFHTAEEEGLLGAKLHAQKAAREKVPIEAVLNNDIVGNEHGGDGIVDGASVRLYAEGPEDSPSRALARFVVRQAARYVPSHRVRPMARPDRFGRGGDHLAYNQYGFAAVGFREARENFARQHDARDTFEGVSPAYLLRNARVDAAAAAVLALAPPPPVVADERGMPTLDRAPSGYDAHLHWKPSPDAAGYRIFWRETWASDWQHERDVGNVTDVVLPDTCIDDFVFAVAAVDAAGHESPAAAYVFTSHFSGDVKLAEPAKP